MNLGDVADVQNGGAWSEAEYSETGIPVVRVTNCQDGAIDLTDCKFLDVKYAPRYAAQELRERDIILTTVGSHPNQPASMVGRSVSVPGEVAGALLNQNAVRIRAAPGRASQAYLRYALADPDFRGFASANARGSANQVRLAISRLKAYPLKIQDYATQTKVGSALLLFDDLIDNTLRRIKILEHNTQALYQEWFGGRRFPGHGGFATTADSNPKSLPSGWSTGSIHDLVVPMRQKYSADEHQHLRLLDLARMTPGTLAPREWGHPDDLSSSRIVFQPMDVLFGAIRPYLRKVMRAPSAGVTNVSVLVLRPKRPHYRSLATAVLSSQDAMRWANQHATGTKMPVVKTEQLLKMPVAIPEAEVCEAFEARVGPMLAWIDVASERNFLLRQARDLLVPRLVSGQLDVSDLNVEVPA